MFNSVIKAITLLYRENK